MSKARQQSNIDKNLAIRYFNKQKAYQSISANKSYADALKYGRNTFAKVNNNLLPPSHITKSDPVKQGLSTRTGRTPANRVNATTCFNKIYKQESPVHITLHNRFDVFNIIDTTDEVDMPSVCHKDVFCDENTGNALSESVQTQLGEQSCPVLERKSKISLVGKNETGCPDGANTHTKLGKTATNNYTSANSVVRDVSTDVHSRTHSVDSKEVFDRNYVLNSCDNVTHISCTRGAENDSNHLNSVVHNLQFGFLPSETLKLYTGDPVYYEQIPDIIATHFMVKKSGLPYFLQCHIPVTSNLNVDRWCFHLLDYWDQQLPDLLEYGFPIDFDQNSALTSTFVNHTSALQNGDHVAKYLSKELQREAIMGLFTKPPFPIHISPLMTRDKQDSQ